MVLELGIDWLFNAASNNRSQRVKRETEEKEKEGTFYINAIEKVLM